MILHIGYHKTGTTFLQNNVFPAFPEVNYYDLVLCKKLFNDVYRRSTLEFDAAAVLSEIESHQVKDNGLPHLYSCELLVGEIGLGTIKKEIADRVKQLGFKKIIITIRNQKRILDSIYRQYIQQGGTAKVDEYFNGRSPLFDYGYCSYYALCSYYIDLFGKENVLIVMQEDLKKNQSAVIKSIADFIGTASPAELRSDKPSNTSLSNLSLSLFRFINHFTFNYYRPSQILSDKITSWKFRHLLQRYLDPWFFSKISSNKSFITPEHSKFIEQYYAKGNQKIGRRIRTRLSVSRISTIQISKDIKKARQSASFSSLLAARRGFEPLLPG